MPGTILDERYIHPAIRNKVAGHQQAIVQEVIATVKDNDVVLGTRVRQFAFVSH